MLKKLLLLNGKLKATREYIQAAHKMGVHVIVSDEFPQEESPGKQLADEMGVLCSKNMSSLSSFKASVDSFSSRLV